MTIFDASALLAVLQAEPTADDVESALVDSGSCATVDWSEVAQKVRALGTDQELARALLASNDPASSPSPSKTPNQPQPVIS